MAHALFTPKADEDLLEIWVYIAVDNADAANRFLDTLKARAATLAESPHLGRPRDELGKGIRSLPIGDYLILYRPAEIGVEVLRVVHGARNLPDLF